MLCIILKVNQLNLFRNHLLISIRVSIHIQMVNQFLMQALLQKTGILTLFIYIKNMSNDFWKRAE